MAVINERWIDRAQAMAENQSDQALEFPSTEMTKD